LALRRDGAGKEAIEADVHDEASVATVFAGVFGVVNAVSLYVERGGRETFYAVHVEAAARIARLARQGRRRAPRPRLRHRCRSSIILGLYPRPR
jgi:hypothetical protein